MIAAILAARARRSRRAAISTITSACRSRCYRLDAAHRYAVIEIGANHPGEVAAARAARAARRSASSPTPAPSTSKASAASKAWRAPRARWSRASSRRRTAVINADDEFAALWRGMTRGARRRPSASRTPADFARARRAHRDRRRRLRHAFQLRAPQGATPIELQLAGAHNVLNALCAAAAACAAGATLDDVRAGLATMRPVPGRLQLKTAPSGAWIVDDSYNANPSSMKAGIEVLAGVDARRWLVMGDMGELGDFAAREPCGDRPVRARARASTGCSRPASCRRSRSRLRRRAREWFADTDDAGARGQRRAHARGVRAGQGLALNRLERVVEALVGSRSNGSNGTH